MSARNEKPALIARNGLNQIGKIHRRHILMLGFLLILPLFAACAGSNVTPGSQVAISPELDQVIKAYFAAFNTYDADALREVITEDYMLYEAGTYSIHNVSVPVSMGFDAAKMSAYAEGYNQRREYQFELIGDPIVSGKGPWLVSQVLRLNALDYPNGIEGISTFTIIDDGGTLKISRDVFIGFEQE